MTEADRDADAPDDEDAKDVRHVLAGDIAAFDGIVERWQGRLINLAWRFSHDRAMAEDMAQEAFVKAFRALGTFRGESEFSTWLIALSLNCYRSWLRRREPMLVSIDPAHLVSSAPSAPAVLQERERAAALRELVLTLPPRYRDAIVVYYFEERSVTATARVLGIPEGTLKARLSRGRDLLGRRYAARMSVRRRSD